MKVMWDPVKRARTLAERDLDFADAEQLFDGPHATVEDARRDYGESRFISAAVLGGRVVVIAWTPRGGGRHVFSMRYCHAREEADWLARLD